VRVSTSDGGFVVVRLCVRFVMVGALVAGFAATDGSWAAGATSPFSNHLLISHWNPPAGLTTVPHADSTGNSEPAIAFGEDGAMAVDGLGWLPFQVDLWKGRFGSVPSFFGGMDTSVPLQGNGRVSLGDGDADVAITSAGTILLADLDIIFTKQGRFSQLGVSVTRCPAGASGPSDCTTAVLDTAGADRPWLTVRGTSAWVSWHDAGNSTSITVKRSTDDGRTWRKVRSPLFGHGDITGNSTYNNSLGPIVADPTSQYIYQPWMSGEQQTKCCSADFNNVYVARSSDGGLTWQVKLVFHAPPLHNLANFWPALAVDNTTGRVWVAWTDLHGVVVSSSGDHGRTWTKPRTVSTIRTTVMPWVAAQGGKVDVVYYGSSAASTDDQRAVWNVYDSQRKTGAWRLLKVSNTPNRVGRVCLEGSACEGNVDRELLDLFEVAEDPLTGKAAVIYTDTTVDVWRENGETHELPEIVLAYER
jgi:hypothetical protein